MAGIQQQFVPDFSPERNLCPKCQTTMLSTKEEKLQHTEYSSREPDTFLLHSESISSLNESRLDNCHLCVQIWEVRPGNFRRLLRLERGIDQKDEQDANETTITGDHEMESTRLLYRWESTMKAHEKARRWDHECRRLVFATSTELATELALDGKSWDEYNKFTDRNAKIIFWMTQASNPSTDRRYPPYNFNWISGGTGSVVTHNLANAWMYTCLTSHTECQRGQELRAGWNPTRVLDVQASDVASGIRLWQPDAASGQILYVTLSHSWGVPDFVTLDRSNYDAFKVEVKEELLTKTFRDAVATTRMLNIRYLWIDSLCIIQKDDEDWLKEAKMMGDVYRYGYCNLAGARWGTNRGLFMKRNPLVVKPLMLHVSNGDKPKSPAELYVFHQQFAEWAEIDNVPINRRAWVMQERTMAPRTLYFGSNQVSYECCAIIASEEWPMSNQSNEMFDRTMKNLFSQLYAPEAIDRTDTLFVGLSYWDEAIKFYSGTNITQDTDRLIAISGLARAIHHKIGVDYKAGLWDFHFERQLMWKVKDTSSTKRASSAVAPSWSWASVIGAVKYNYSVWTEDAKNKTSVTFVKKGAPHVDDPSPFGTFKSGEANNLIMKGQLVRGVVGIHRPELGRTGAKQQRISGAVLDTLDVDEAETYALLLAEDPGINGDSKTLTKLLGRMDLCGLLLLPTGRKTGEFRRCGMFVVQHGDDTKRLRRELKDFCAKAGETGLPFDKGKHGNEFLVTIV